MIVYDEYPEKLADHVGCGETYRMEINLDIISVSLKNVKPLKEINSTRKLMNIIRGVYPPQQPWRHSPSTLYANHR